MLIRTKRFILRELTESDATQTYLDWLKDTESKKYISAASKENSISSLKSFIADRIGRDDLLFLGIFECKSNLHIGNIKYEPIDSKNGYAIMGILIGDTSYRGKGVAAEVLEASSKWLKQNKRIKQIALGVHESNTAAIRAYEKIGFRIGPTDYIQPSHSSTITMLWNI